MLRAVGNLLCVVSLIIIEILHAERWALFIEERGPISLYAGVISVPWFC